jgi:general secretion pathway protein K
MSARGDRGYAMVAAVAGIAAFAMIAFQTLAANRGAIASVTGQIENARLAAAADAGVAAAIYGLSIPDPKQRWTIDGRVRVVQFGGMALQIFVEDEHGKIPINRLNEDQVRQMFAAAGVSGKPLDTLVDCFEDWQDEDDDKRPDGAEAPDYLPLGIKPRNGDIRTVGEMAVIKGMNEALYERLAPSLTVFFGETGSFSVENAQPLALAVLSGTSVNSPDVIERERELAGEKPALDTGAPPINLTGRPLTIRVSVRDAMGGAFVRDTIVELTGNKVTPFWIRYAE